MELVKTGKSRIQIHYIGIDIEKISCHDTVKSAEDELRLFKEDIKKEDLKRVMEQVKVYMVEELDIINLGKGIDK